MQVQTFLLLRADFSLGLDEVGVRLQEVVVHLYKGIEILVHFSFVFASCGLWGLKTD